jgi:hypothetical protein
MNLVNLTNSEWHTELLTETTVINAFDCEDNELNDFLLNDAKNYLKSLLAVTYLIKVQDEIIAYFCLSNDRLTKDEEEKSTYKSALPFYEKNEFKYLTDKDKSGETRAMYFDLKVVN